MCTNKNGRKQSPDEKSRYRCDSEVYAKSHYQKTINCLLFTTKRTEVYRGRSRDCVELIIICISNEFRVESRRPDEHFPKYDFFSDKFKDKKLMTLSRRFLTWLLAFSKLFFNRCGAIRNLTSLNPTFFFFSKYIRRTIGLNIYAHPTCHEIVRRGTRTPIQNTDSLIVSANFFSKNQTFSR